MLTFTRAALLPYSTRANDSAMCDKSYTTNCPTLLPIEDNGWSKKEGSGLYVTTRCLILPAPRAAIELTKCGCNARGKRQCSCCKNGLPETPLCKCYGAYCGNGIVKNVEVDDEVDDEED